MGNLCRTGPAAQGDTPIGVQYLSTHDAHEAGFHGTAGPVHCPLSRKLLCFGDSDSFENRRIEALEENSPMDAHSEYAYHARLMGMEHPQLNEGEEESVCLPPCSAACASRGGVGSPERAEDVSDDDATGEPVELHLYDLNDTLAHMNSVSLDLLGIGGALHVGVEVLGNEWSFGMQGVSASKPRNNQYYVYRQTVSMGRTKLQRKEVISAILAMQSEWAGNEYDIFCRNCGTFCNALCMRLGVGAMPSWVTRLAETMGKLPAMRSLAGVISRASGPPEEMTPGRRPFPHLHLEDMEEERPWVDEVCTPQHQRGCPGRTGFRMPAHPGLVAAGSPVRASPVRCRFSSSPGPRGRPLPQQRCEGFRIHDGQSHSVGSGGSVQHPSTGLPVDVATDKCGGAVGAPDGRRRVMARGGG